MILPVLCSCAPACWLMHLGVTGCRQCMKESKGTANPGLMNKILMQKLSAK